MVTILLVTLELQHVASTNWLGFFLYTSDGLTLPLLRESLAQHQLWQPIMSTQLLVFPEAALYAVCAAVTTSIRASLVMNAYLNVLLLYGAARMLAAAVVPRVGRRGLASCVFTGCLVLFMLLEVQPSGGQLQFATLTLLTTYYYGLLLGGVVLVGCTVRQLRPSAQRFGNRPWALLAVVTSTLTYASDPLFALWVTTPIVLTIGLLVALRRVTTRSAAAVLGCQVASLAAGSVLRIPFAHVIGSSASSYVKFNQIGRALTQFGAMVTGAWSYPSERLEFVVLLGVVAVAAIQFAQLLRWPADNVTESVSTALFVVTFALVAPLVDIFGVLASGNSTNRYFIPAVVFPLLALISVVGRFRRPSKVAVADYRTGLAVGGVALVGTLALLPGLNPLVNPSDFAAGQCFGRIASIRGLTGVGDFWTSRTLEAYGTGDTHVLQVLANFLPHGWLVNLGEFDHRTVSFVVVDRVVGPPIGLVAADTDRLGRPTSISSCPGFDVYTYPPGTHGYTVLNQEFRLWANEEWRVRR